MSRVSMRKPAEIGQPKRTVGTPTPHVIPALYCTRLLSRWHSTSSLSNFVIEVVARKPETPCSSK